MKLWHPTPHGEDLFGISRQIPPPAPIKPKHWPIEFWLAIGLILFFWLCCWIIEPDVFMLAG